MGEFIVLIMVNKADRRPAIVLPLRADYVNDNATMENWIFMPGYINYHIGR